MSDRHKTTAQRRHFSVQFSPWWMPCTNRFSTYRFVINALEDKFICYCNFVLSTHPPVKWILHVTTEVVNLTRILIAKMPTSKVIMHVCSHINWFPTPWVFALSLRLAQKCQQDSWQSYSNLCNKVICNHILNFTLTLTFSSTMLFLGCCWLQDPSSATGTRFSFLGVLSYKLYNTPHPSSSPSIWARLTLKLQCFLPHWLQHVFLALTDATLVATTTTHHPTILFPKLPVHHLWVVSLSPQVSFTQKMLLAVLLNIFQFLSPVSFSPPSCSKYLILASSAHNDSFQYICCIFKVYLSHAHDLEEAHQKRSTRTYSRNVFKSFSLWKLQWKLQFQFC